MIKVALKGAVVVTFADRREIYFPVNSEKNLIFPLNIFCVIVFLYVNEIQINLTLRRKGKG